MKNILIIVLAFLLSFSISLLISQQMHLTTFTLSTPSLNSPSNDTWTNDSTPDFSFTAISDIDATFGCGLFIDNSSYGSKSDVQNGTATTITASPSLSEGSHSWHITCTDVNGSLDSESRTIKIDTQTPITTDNSSGSWSLSDQTISLNCSDIGSGCSQTLYCIDTSNSCTPNTAGTTASITCSSGQTCSKYLRYQSTDAAGNQEAVKSVQIKIDKQAPTTNATAKVNDESYSFDTWANDSIQVTLNCSDSGSGCDKTLYCKDTNNSCNPGTTYSSAFTISTENISYIRYRSNDTLNNTESNKSAKIDLDTADPSVTLNISSLSIIKGTSITINCTANDTLSGIKTINISSNSTKLKECSSSPCTTSYTPTNVQSYSIACKAFDNALNSREDTETLEVKNQTSSGTGGTGGAGNQAVSYTRNLTQAPPQQQPQPQPSSNQSQNQTGNGAFMPSEAEVSYDLGALQEAKITAGKGEIIGFNTSEEHMIRIDTIETDHITLTVWSDPVNLALSVNQTEQVNLNSSKITITLLEIKDGKAVLELKAEKGFSFKFPKIGWWFWPLLILVALIVIWLVVPTMPREKSGKHNSWFRKSRKK